MASGSYMTPIYSRSQNEVQGDLHKWGGASSEKDDALPKLTVYTRIKTDETSQQGVPMVRDSLTNLKNPRSYMRALKK
ncbi:hypothetical protein TNCV_4217731 [Trichonephila clavipes]|nr:hypothetical protein TNCV_4217731 [Trichonephila clavipes]